MENILKHVMSLPNRDNDSQARETNPEDPELSFSRQDQIRRIRRLLEILTTEEAEDNATMEVTGRGPIMHSTPIQEKKEEPQTGITNEIAGNLTEAIKQLAWNSTLKQKPTSTFSAMEHEDPEEFLQAIEKYFESKKIEDDQLKLQVITQQLRGSAERWHEQYKGLIRTYAQFAERLRTRFNTTAILAAGRSRLYGEKQGTAEAVEVFITRKMNLFRRYDKHLPEAMQISVIIEQIKPEIRACLRSQQFQEVETLIRTSAQIESDLQKVYRPPSRTITTGRENAATATPRETRPNEQENQPEQRNLRPCRFCQQRHLMRFCPQNPYRQGNYNAGGAGPLPTAPPAEDN